MNYCGCILLINHRKQKANNKIMYGCCLALLVKLGLFRKVSYVVCVCVCGVCFKAFAFLGEIRDLISSPKNTYSEQACSMVLQKDTYIYLITDCPKAAHTVDLSGNISLKPSRVSIGTSLLCNEIYSKEVEDSKREEWVLWPRGKDSVQTTC